MNSLADYFHTDWAAMTTSDWVGTVLTVVIFLLMLVVYLYALRPKNRDRLEAQRFIPLDNEELNNGENNGG
ncbi:MAG: cbb3-type cytochrome c oxidase subunit 3 [Gammaproteobacteria bacterium]|nr:cbb3-type cytochrome c oxidase subunit 3 [Gammaproteobacteria bacterium]